MEILQKISEELQKGNYQEVPKLVQQALDAKIPPAKILSDGLVAGPDIVFDCSGDPVAGAQAIHFVRGGGQVIWVSIFQQPVTVDGNALVRRDITLQAARSRLPQTWFRAMRFLEQKRVRVLELVTHRFPLTQAPDLFEIMLRREGIKGLLLTGPSQKTRGKGP